MDEFNHRKPMNLRRRGIYLLPNLFTTGALFAGFYAIVQAMNGYFEPSAVAISSPWCWMGWMDAWLAGRIRKANSVRNTTAFPTWFRSVSRLLWWFTNG